MIKKFLRKVKRALHLSRNIRLVILDFPPGHYYSPIVNKKDISQKKELFEIPKEIKGISLNESEQLSTLKQLMHYYKENTFPENQTKGDRYFFKNKYYSYSDALFLYSIMRHFKPKNIIEAGSGFSSAVMLDTNDQFFDSSIKLTFIEPYPDRLFSLMNEHDRKNTPVLRKTIQSVPLDTFSRLGENDILFIDTSHAVKAGSDVNRIIFDILPHLNKGVLIHFHDIFYPFEYPEEWLAGWSGFGWNEGYLLRAFLMYNPNYKIELFNSYLQHFHEDWFRQNMPKCLLHQGQSIWIRKIN